ncbi:MAG: hypothetical protein LBQ06_00255 [Frankiaceae bacterium]|nr:hypothetical protein [Frankiaceae bacterium]
MGISGAILADVADMRRAASLVEGVRAGYQASLGEFQARWGCDVGAGWNTIGLPPLQELGNRLGEVAGYLRQAAGRYDEADRFAEFSAADQMGGMASTLASVSVAAAISLASRQWIAPRIDPRVGGGLVDGAEAIIDIGALALPALGGSAGVRRRAIAREAAARPQIEQVGEPADARAPRSVAELAERVARLGSNGANTAIEIVTGPDGARRAIVYLRGTTRWDSGSADPTDLDGNIVALAGCPTVYGRGVVEAMRAAGIDSSMPVLLVGHSQGGMVAANLTRELAESGEFAVTDLLTFGAPFAQMDHPVAAGVQLIALENRSDVTPDLDGRRNSRAAGSITVTFDDGDVNLAAHDMDGYRAGAAALDASRSAAALAVTARLSGFASG